MSSSAVPLSLAVEASASAYCVALGSGEEPAAQLEQRRNEPGFKGLGNLVSIGLAEIGGRFANIESVGIDIGPGNYSSVRAAVSYVNGLAYSLTIPIYRISSLELMAIGAIATGAPPPILALQKGPAGHAYAALYADSENVSMRYGRLESIAAVMATEIGQLSVAGAFRDILANLLDDLALHDTKIEQPDVRTLYKAMRASSRDSASWAPIVSPLNEASKVFHERPAVHHS